MQVLNKFFFLVIFLSGVLSAQAQLKIDTSYTVEDMVNKILMGNGVKVGNIRMKGSKLGVGYFHVNSDVIGMRNGILLSTGKVHDAIGPNNAPGRSGIISTPQTLKNKDIGDVDLNRLCGGRTQDVMVIEFDFIPVHNKISFRYCFGSEEYKEYVGSRFNDVFGFFIDGPGLPKRNLAVIPGTDESVAVNNINHKKYRKIYLNNDYFVDIKNTDLAALSGQQSGLKKLTNTVFQNAKVSLNDDAVLIDEKERSRIDHELLTNFQYDGFTHVLTAECQVIPHKKYHLKLAIGDVGDYALDSGVFLEAGSFSSEDDPRLPNFHASAPGTTDVIPVTSVDQNEIATISGNKKDVVSYAAPKNIDVFKTTNVYFATDSYSVPDSSKDELGKLAAYLLKNKTLVCQLYGHTDNVGSKEHNQQLSEDRAVAVIKYLISQGITKSRLSYTGYNFEEPVGNNEKEVGRQYNRRVEITVVDSVMQASRQ
ncbi:OmpA family protein [Cytophagaceae bacterium DM2B3-1]|uniref:OmpA family protein n=1 Tax=Xanthocytophaga flava TaxID=3048013 RepID=A0ABT7CT10_9BACT|nr:OmpA family protein [Xanthocytophaga flavus]MDJ1496879.1 OmpA family protein [Xanthocytophaga flavus]